jgi:ParB-like chromosome segregation protein Spo0J
MTMSYDPIQWIQAESLFLDWEIPYELIPELAIDSIKTEDYSQVRLSKHRAPADNVDRYTLMMRNGATFPPIVVAANDKSVIDGNTRIAAARRLGYETIPAYVVKPAYASTARRIGAALNQLSGETLADEELQAVARDFLEDQMSDTEIGRRLGRTAEWARKFRRREEFVTRAGSHPNFKSIPKAAAEKLVDIPLDAPLIRVLDQADKVKIDRGWATKLADAATSQRSEAASVEAVEAVLAEITPVQQAGTRKPTAVRDRLHGLVVKLEKVVAELDGIDVPLVQPHADEYRTRLSACRRTIDALIDRLPTEQVEEAVAS